MKYTIDKKTEMKEITDFHSLTGAREDDTDSTLYKVVRLNYLWANNDEFDEDKQHKFSSKDKTIIFLIGNKNIKV